MPAYRCRRSEAVAGAADHAFLSGYNDKAILGTDKHALQSSPKEKKNGNSRERATGRGHGHAPEDQEYDGGNF